MSSPALQILTLILKGYLAQRCAEGIKGPCNETNLAAATLRKT